MNEDKFVEEGTSEEGSCSLKSLAKRNKPRMLVSPFMDRRTNLSMWFDKKRNL